MHAVEPDLYCQRSQPSTAAEMPMVHTEDASAARMSVSRSTTTRQWLPPARHMSVHHFWPSTKQAALPECTSYPKNTRCYTDGAARLLLATSSCAWPVSA